jgi:hypothetical protein
VVSVVLSENNDIAKKGSINFFLLKAAQLGRCVCVTLSQIHDTFLVNVLIFQSCVVLPHLGSVLLYVYPHPEAHNIIISPDVCDILYTCLFLFREEFSILWL